MQEQDTKPEVPPKEIQQTSSSGTEKDALRFTQSKRMFFQESFLNRRTDRENVVSRLKPNSKILKKKRHKEKFKFFKLDKHLLDPIQCHLGKSGKFYKKKDKLATVLQNSSSKIPVGEKACWAGRKSQIWLFPQPKPLGYPFDILSSTATSRNPIVTDQEGDAEKPMVNHFLYAPVPSLGVTNKPLMGDLIDLGTPNKFDIKVSDEISDSKNQLPSMISPMETSSGIVQSRVVRELKESLLESVEVKEQPSNSAQLVLLDDINFAQENITAAMSCQREERHFDYFQLPGNSVSVDERVGSPMMFHGCPHLHSPPDENEKQQMSSTFQMQFAGRSRQTLVSHLSDNPFPKIVRERAKVRVRRRAFSMDDTLMESLPFGPAENEEPSDYPHEAANTQKISNTEGPCPHTLESSSSQKSNEPNEDKKHFTLDDESEIIALSNAKDGCSNSDEIVRDNMSENLDRSAVESNSDTDVDGTMGLNTHSTPLTSERHSTQEESSDIASVEPSGMNISEQDWSILENSDGSPPIIKESEQVIEIETAENETELNSEVASFNMSTQQAEDRTGIVTNKETGEERGNTLDETHCATSSPVQIAELKSQRISNRKLQFSPNQDFKSDRMNNSPNFGQDGSNRTPEMELVDSGDHYEKDGSGLRDILGRNTLVQTRDEGHLTTEDTCLQPKMNLPVSQETSTTVRYGVYSSEQSTGSIERSDVDGDGDLEKYSNRTLSNISTGEVDLIQRVEQTAAKSTESIKERVTPTNVTFEHSSIDSSFSEDSCVTPLNHWVLPPGKKFRRSLSIIRNLDEPSSVYSRRGRHYEKSVEEIIRLQGDNAEARTPVQNLCKRLSNRRSSWMRQMTPPRARRSTFMWSPIPDRGTLYETPRSRKSIYSTPMQQNLINRLSVRNSPVLGPGRSMSSPFKQGCAPTPPVQYTFRDLILTICKQAEPCRFSDIVSAESYEGGCKIGEGVFGEVFSIRRDHANTVLKIIPVEGHQLVNGEKQKTYQEVFSELVIAKELDELRYEGTDDLNFTSGYAEIIATSLVQDSYPEPLLRFWDAFDQTKGSDNENPKMFDKEQLFIVMEQSNGGKDLESYIFSSAKQSLSIFKQIAFSLAVAEKSVEFEHRDLHWGNVLVSKTSERNLIYTLNGTQHSVATNGVRCTIIDYTLSRIKYINQVPIFNDIGKDPEMFIATGDYQFDIYRLMKNDVEDDWSRFAPKTNARWLHYLLDKILTKVKYQRKTAKVHKDSLKILGDIYKWVEGCGSAYAIALRLAELKH